MDVAAKHHSPPAPETGNPNCRSRTTTYRWFLAGWAKRLSWKGVADAFDTTWQNVFRSLNT